MVVSNFSRKKFVRIILTILIGIALFNSAILVTNLSFLTFQGHTSVVVLSSFLCFFLVSNVLFVTVNASAEVIEVDRSRLFSSLQAIRLLQLNFSRRLIISFKLSRTIMGRRLEVNVKKHDGSILAIRIPLLFFTTAEIDKLQLELNAILKQNRLRES